MSTLATQRVHNFSAGPAVLPLPVLEEVQKELLCLPGAGASVLEISHRSKQFEAIIQGAEQNIRKLLGLDDDWAVLFLQGGASTQFSMVAMNFLEGRKAGYVRCGAWSKKAIKEAKKHGQVEVVWDGEGDGFTRMPATSELKVEPGLAYLHTTSNETIEGIQYSVDPEVSVPLVCDASSDFLHRPITMKPYGLIYAGAQKNVGPAGCTLVLLRKSFLKTQVDKTLPTMLDYTVHVEKESMFNTPPAFSIYVIEKVTRWLLDLGGLEAIHEKNRKKAELLYQTIDGSQGFYRGHAAEESRSLMNVTFRLPREELEKQFVVEAEAKGLSGLKGHRSVGGLRASIYNAFELEGVEALVSFMQDFQRRNA